MNKRAFTLIEVLVTLCILAIVSLMVCSTVCVSKKYESINMKCMEMTYLSEMIIENLKAAKSDHENNIYICKTEVNEIINLFETNKSANISLNYQGQYDNYNILIDKKERSDRLWEVCVTITYIKVGGKQSVKIKTLIPSQ